jgi:hypothetical protein
MSSRSQLEIKIKYKGVLLRYFYSKYSKTHTNEKCGEELQLKTTSKCN